MISAKGDFNDFIDFSLLGIKSYLSQPFSFALLSAKPWKREEEPIVCLNQRDVANLSTLILPCFKGRWEVRWKRLTPLGESL